MSIRLVMLGDVVGPPGILAIEQLMPALRERYKPDLVLANAENACNGSGLTPQLYQQLMSAGVDAMTLGDHVYKKVQITSVLESRSNLIRPANISKQARGPRWMQLPLKKHGVNLYVTTVLGRIFAGGGMLADDPFETIEVILGQLPELNPLVLVEVHAEATSEKRALGYYFDGRVAAVIGTHTHVQTADAQILPRGTGYITDIGMTGPHESIIGRRIDRVVQQMTTSMPAAFDVADGDPRINGVFLEIDPATRQTERIERIEMAADPHKPPFAKK